MIRPIEIITENCGSDERTSIRYSVDDFKRLERGTRLRQLYDYWVRLPRNEFGLPDESQCCANTNVSGAETLLGSWIETRAEDPLDFIIRDHAASDIAGYGNELSGQPLASHPDFNHAYACMAECLFCKTDREPVYHEILQKCGAIKRLYSRIMLPIDDENGQVSRIYYSVRPLIRFAVGAVPTVEFEDI